MKALRPWTIVTAGPLLLGVAVAVGASVAIPHSHELPGFGWLLIIGAAAGLAMFGPIAAILALAKRNPGWLARHSWRIDFYSSVAMALAMGYLAACMRHNIADNLLIAAFAIVFVGATVKTALGYALRQQRKADAR